MDAQEELNLSCSLTTYGPGAANIDYKGDYTQNTQFSNLLINGFEKMINASPEGDWVKLKGRFSAVQVLVKDCASGFGFGAYQNNSDQKMKLKVTNSRKNLDLSKPNHLKPKNFFFEFFVDCFSLSVPKPGRRERNHY